MGRALELVTGFATAPSSTFTALTMASGNTATVRNFSEGSRAYLLQAWTDSQGAGTFRIRSSQMHDNVQGIRLDTQIGNVVPRLPFGTRELLYAQETLTLEITGSATGGDIETACLLIYYEDIPGIDARLLSWEDVAARMVHTLTVENTLSLGTGGGYSGEEAINSEFDLLKANTDYAILGYFVDTECAAIRYRGADLGNTGVGGPGEPDIVFATNDWFVRLSRFYGLPLIPVFNSANRGSLLIDGAQDENGADPTLTTILAELS